jgi:hypothetical protein
MVPNWYSFCNAPISHRWAYSTTFPHNRLTVDSQNGPPPARLYSCCLGVIVGLIRGTGPSIRSLYESGSAIEQMTARMLHEHGARPSRGEIRS